MRKKNIGFEIFVIIGLLVFSLIVFGIYSIIELFNSQKDYVMFLKPFTILDCNKWDCKNVSDKLNDYNSEDYNVYLDGIYKGINEVFYNAKDEKYYVFNSNNDNIYNDERLFAYNGKASIVQKDYEISDVDFDELSKIKSSVNLTFGQDNVSKVKFDFDDDGETENLYVINSDDGVNKHSILLFNDGDSYNILEDISSKDLDDFSFSYISNVIDIFDDGKVEFIYTKAFYDNVGSCSVIYRLKGKKFVSVNECEIVR